MPRHGELLREKVGEAEVWLIVGSERYNSKPLLDAVKGRNCSVILSNTVIKLIERGTEL